MRLDKFLSEFNIGTRKQIKEILKNGRCSVNGLVALRPDLHVDENSDTVKLDGEVLSYKKFRYYLINKPAGVVSATRDGKNRTVLDLLDGENLRDVSPCGRLDADTEGLLILTNDGELIHRLLSPKRHVDKVYEVHLEKEPDDIAIQKLESGVDIGDLREDGSKDLTLPAHVENAGTDPDGRAVILLTIHEGRFHQVKRMMESVGNKVLFLRRIQMGPLKLDEELLPGQYRELTDEEISILKTS
ncbi:MAG: rRNA pseudouridine synthase [Butyrivibrio sp.]|nr:rRNA pseudouridine synthase [Butyrivibrio sp.]